MTDCLFCKIVAGTIPCDAIAQNDRALAFHDINPVAPVHFLVIPRRHIVNIEGMEDEHNEDVAACLALARDAARQVGIDVSGYRVITNNGADGGQVVQHLHFHVLGGKKLGWPGIV